MNLEQLAAQRGDHSVFAPSGSSRWLLCPGSLIPNLLAPDNSGYDAALGTVAHAMAEIWLTEGKPPRHRIGDVEWIINGGKLYQIEIDAMMLDYVERYVDWCLMLPGDHYVEQRVDFSCLTPIPNQSGTSDFIACTFKRLVVTDLKYGKGVQVFAEANTQGMLYALGAFYEHDWLYGFEEIEIRICQPRLEHFDTWVVSREVLLEFAEYVRERSRMAWDLNAPRIAGAKQCTFCRVKADCPANAKMARDVTRLMFADEFVLDASEVAELKEEIRSGGFEIKPPEPAKLSTDELAQVVKFRKAVEAWFKTVEIELYRRACAGIPVAGHKLVEGRSNREFIDEEAAIKVLVDYGVDELDTYTVKTVSPTQAEDLLIKAGHKRKAIPLILTDKLVRKPSGKPTLVLNTDKRRALSSKIEAMWADDEDEAEAEFD